MLLNWQKSNNIKQPNRRAAPPLQGAGKQRALPATSSGACSNSIWAGEHMNLGGPLWSSQNFHQT